MTLKLKFKPIASPPKLDGMYIVIYEIKIPSGVVISRQIGFAEYNQGKWGDLPTANVVQWTVLPKI